MVDKIINYYILLPGYFYFYSLIVKNLIFYKYNTVAAAFWTVINVNVIYI